MHLWLRKISEKCCSFSQSSTSTKPSASRFLSKPPWEKLMESHPNCRLYSMMIDGHSVPGMWEASGLESPDVMFEKSFAWFQKNCLDIETLTAQIFAKSLKTGRLFYLSSCCSARLGEGFGKTANNAACRCSSSLAEAAAVAEPIQQAPL